MNPPRALARLPIFLMALLFAGCTVSNPTVQFDTHDHSPEQQTAESESDYWPTTSQATALAPDQVIDDRDLRRQWNEKITAIMEDEDAFVPMQELRDQFDRSRTSLELVRPRDVPMEAPELYEFVRPSVFYVGGADYRESQEQYRLAGGTGFAIAHGGYIATNRHVIDRENSGTLMIADARGNVYPVLEVLASDARLDLAIIRVDFGDDPVQPLALRFDAPIGTDVWLLSHPNRHLYAWAGGNISRYYRRYVDNDEQGVVTMTITAPWAGGSSGGPAVDRYGSVLGVATRIQPARGRLGSDGERYTQMITGQTVPTTQLLKLLDSPATD